MLFNDLAKLINIFSNYPLQGKLMNIVINDKEEATILRLENIVQALKETLFEMDELIQLNPKRNLKIIKSGNSKHEVAQKYKEMGIAEENFADASRQAVIDMVDDISSALGTK